MIYLLWEIRWAAPGTPWKGMFFIFIFHNPLSPLFQLCFWKILLVQSWKVRLRTRVYSLRCCFHIHFHHYHILFSLGQLPQGKRHARVSFPFHFHAVFRILQASHQPRKGPPKPPRKGPPKMPRKGSVPEPRKGPVQAGI